MTPRGEGLTASEKYLKGLCEKTFLSLWSFTNVFREPGTELCDLLVVIGNDVIIFSDKQCFYPQTDSPQLDWQRWFRRAVENSARQLWGAEKWLRKYPAKVFTDNKCEHGLPLPVSITERTNFHLVLVAHGASLPCLLKHGGTGSLMFDNKISGCSNHTVPFTIGDLHPARTFVHVLDDNTLNVVLQNRDTISDFTAYLTKRENFLRSEVAFSALVKRRC